MNKLIIAAIAASVSLSALAAAPAATPACPQKQMQGDVSRADALKRAGEHFDLMDKDHNGVVTQAERQTWRDSMREQCPRAGKHMASGPRGQGKMMPKGDLTRAEALKHAEQMFDRADADHNGVVTQAERRAMHQQMREKRQAGAGQDTLW
ncbi:EF-hand domain-containing protein [Chitinilyticum piscinae]|uniref:EF-hand domain-containing protein n=1 Tax=Chitinilyticum piscinae TaxID=2866724 RepID=A0A8J7KG94_9NEIS|nr:EF-hand domain-containing protein [Chitinilyticum piscinae]MBE9610254.1 EF-hand domain-containing protein [Chitinilyticum piscinae]